MKLVLFFVVAFLRLPLYSCAQYVVDSSTIVVNINGKAFTNCKGKRNPCFVLPIERNKEQTVIMILPVSGGSISTFTYATIYKKQDYERYYENPVVLEYKRKNQDEKTLSEGQPLTLNLTSLADGRYIIVYKADALFVWVEVSISTS